MVSGKILVGFWHDSGRILVGFWQDSVGIGKILVAFWQDSDKILGGSEVSVGIPMILGGF